MLALVRARIDLERAQGLLKTRRATVTNRLWPASPWYRARTHRQPRCCGLVGVAPFTRKSGNKTATARIQGGRAAVRNNLYMAAVSASRWNPVLRQFYQRLLKRGKKDKVALIAVLRRSSCSQTLCSSPDSLERGYCFLTEYNTVDSGLALSARTGMTEWGDDENDEEHLCRFERSLGCLWSYGVLRR